MTNPKSNGSGWLVIKNWSEFQHYKNRNPPWIKLHRALIDDYSFSALPDHLKAHLVLLWILASQNDGKVPYDTKFLSKKICASEPLDLDLLISAGFLIPEQDAGNSLAAGNQAARKLLAEHRSSEEKRRGEKKSCAIASHEKVDPVGFSECWEAYPRREGSNSRKEAQAAYRARLMAGVAASDLLNGVQCYATYAKVTGIEGTTFVKQAKSFFGTGEHWLNAWAIPVTQGKAQDNHYADHLLGAI